MFAGCSWANTTNQWHYNIYLQWPTSALREYHIAFCYVYVFLIKNYFHHNTFITDYLIKNRQIISAGFLNKLIFNNALQLIAFYFFTNKSFLRITIVKITPEIPAIPDKIYINGIFISPVWTLFPVSVVTKAVYYTHLTLPTT